LDTDREYRIRTHRTPETVSPASWNDLLARQHDQVPFMRHEYLAALHESASATGDTGWLPHIITVERAGELVAGCWTYLKSHSYGEYVFDWAWADAYRQHGLRYYPKLLTAVPFTPVPGTRLLAMDDHGRDLLVGQLEHEATTLNLSSAHALFLSEDDVSAFRRAGWMIRQGVQFHWANDTARPVVDFADLLARLQREKRKNVLQERRKVAEAGLRIACHQGDAITVQEWDFFYSCYVQTYRDHHSTPYLTREFFSRVAASMPGNWLLFVAFEGEAPVASSLIAIDPSTRTAWGRYWGAMKYIPCLHFEMCYYRPLEWCIVNGYLRFEGGAQGEHKMARGLLPVETHSAHWLSDARFADAVAKFLAQEGQGVAAYVDELRDRSPFRPGMAPEGSNS